MRYHDYRAVAGPSAHVGANELFRDAVQGIRCLVEYHERRPPDEGTREGDSLHLPARKLQTAAPDRGVVSIRQLANEGVRIRIRGRLEYFDFGGILPAVADVLSDTRAEQVRVLADPRDLP